MSEIVLGKSGKIKVQDVDGAMYELRRPTVKEIIDFEKLNKEESTDKVDHLFSFLEKLGLPKVIGEKLTIDESDAIVSAIITKKKA